jgi:hypothetical protein
LVVKSACSFNAANALADALEKAEQVLPADRLAMFFPFRRAAAHG